jgi:hypothetical protein
MLNFEFLNFYQFLLFLNDLLSHFECCILVLIFELHHLLQSFLIHIKHILLILRYLIRRRLHRVLGLHLVLRKRLHGVLELHMHSLHLSLNWLLYRRRRLKLLSLVWHWQLKLCLRRFRIWHQMRRHILLRLIWNKVLCWHLSYRLWPNHFILLWAC